VFSAHRSREQLFNGIAQYFPAAELYDRLEKSSLVRKLLSFPAGMRFYRKPSFIRSRRETAIASFASGESFRVVFARNVTGKPLSVTTTWIFHIYSDNSVNRAGVNGDDVDKNAR